MTDLSDELLTERRRARGWFRDSPPAYDPTRHEPTERDRREVEPPLNQETTR